MKCVIIKGIEIPESCAKCQFMAKNIWCFAVKMQDKLVDLEKRPDWCPLEETEYEDAID